MKVATRPATKEDAANLAVLIDMAGHGLPCWLWQKTVARGDAGSALEVGRSRACRDEGGGFSWRNAIIAEGEGRVLGMALGYRQPAEMEQPGGEDIDAVLLPLAELECEAAGSWYLNAIAVYPEFRGRGVARKLLEIAAAQARQTGAGAVSLIVEDVNAPAIALYRTRGFRETARRAYVAFPGGPRAAAWLLMTRSVDTTVH